MASRLPHIRRMVDANIVRREFPSALPDYAIHVTTERLPEGAWAVVASIKHRSGYGEKTIDLPVPDRTFRSQAEAEDFGARAGVEWLEQNAPRTAA
jgi:hypothetical protein